MPPPPLSSVPARCVGRAAFAMTRPHKPGQRLSVPAPRRQQRLSAANQASIHSGTSSKCFVRADDGCNAQQASIVQQQAELVRELQRRRNHGLQKTALCLSSNCESGQVLHLPGGERVAMDAVATLTECARVVAAFRRAATEIFGPQPGPERHLPPLGDAAEKLLGPDVAALTHALVERVQQRLQNEWECELEPAGALLGWISAKCVDLDGAASYTVPHVDQANVATYDLSSILYLNSPLSCITTSGTADHSEVFEGGAFAFNDSEADVLVEPKAGRLLAFSSGVENLHQVTPVTMGDRFTLAMWFTRGVNLPKKGS